MRRHFRFLRQHRAVLKLKVNAQEDLLLNGARQPTHRGICQHLLAKVEKKRVEAAVQRLTPAESTRLLEGIVAFSPDLAYVLLYLECARQSAPAATAAAAVNQALKLINFSEVSAAQMRRVLDLIVEVFTKSDRARLLFGLLDSSSFRRAFDKSTEALPVELAEIVVPLRAVHAVVFKRRANPHSPHELRRGVNLLVEALGGSDTEDLLPDDPEAVGRLLELGVQAGLDEPTRTKAGLAALVALQSRHAESRRRASLAYVRFLVVSGQPDEASRRLRDWIKADPHFKLGLDWLSALQGPKIARFHLLDRGSEGKQSQTWRPRQDRFCEALDSRSGDWVALRFGASSDQKRYENLTQIHRHADLPSVVWQIAFGTLEDGVPYQAVMPLGTPLSEFQRRRGTSVAEVRPLCRDLVLLVAALNQRAILLPDVKLWRFCVDAQGRLWLRDLLDARLGDDAAAAQQAIQLAKQACQELLRRSVDWIANEAAAQKLDAATSAEALVEALALQ